MERPYSQGRQAGVRFFGRSVERPPILHQPAVSVSFGRQLRTPPHRPARFPLEVLLGAAASGLLDMDAPVQQPPAVKAAVNIADVGSIAQMPDQKEQLLPMLDALEAAIFPASAPCRSLAAPLMHRPGGPSASAGFCHMPSGLARCG